MRSPQRLLALTLFSILIMVVFQFAIPPESPVRTELASGLVWAALLLSANLEARFSFLEETTQGTIDGLRIHAGSTAVFAAKLISSLLVLMILAAFLIGWTILAFEGRTEAVLPGVLAVFGGLLGLLAWATLFAAMGHHSSGELVLPVLLFPLVIPQTIATVRLLTHFLAGVPLDSPATAFLILAAFDAVALGTSLLLFDYALEE